MAVFTAVRSTGRRGWPIGGQIPPIAVARAMVCALMRAAKNMISQTIKMIMPKTELGRRFPAFAAFAGRLDSIVVDWLLMFCGRVLQTGIDCLFCRVIFPILAAMVHDVRRYRSQ